MSVSRALPGLLLAAALLSQCGRAPEKQREEPKAPEPAAAPSEATPDPTAFADPGEDAPISDITFDPTTRHLVAISRQGRRIGATQVPTGLWSWKTKLTQPPALVTVHPITGEGFLIWQSDGAAGVVRFRPTTGETSSALDLGAIADPFRAAAFDTERNRLFLATAQALLCLDLRNYRLVGPRPGTTRFPFVEPLDLAIDARRGLAILPHAGKGVTLLDIAAWGSYGIRAPAVEIPIEAPHTATPAAVAVDGELGRAFVLDGREWLEIDLETRQIARWTAFEPEREFASGRMVYGASCRRLYVACEELIEVDVESGQWESIVALGQCPAPVVHATGLSAVFTIHNGQIYSAYHRCGPG